MLQAYILLSNTPFNARIYGIKSDYNQQLSNGLKLQTGLQFVYSLRNSSGSYLNQAGSNLLPNEQLNNNFRYKENINAAYANFNKDYKRFSFQAGLRIENTYSNGKVFYNKFNKDSSFTVKYLNAFPTAYFSYNLDSAANHKLRFSAGRRITRPSYQDLNPSVFFFDKYTSNQGNPLLQPEYSLNFELGYSHKVILT
jgi:iron complex outermembrane receptor protein